ncbi:MAG: cytochrome c peroxidase [Bacteriovorax sp.]|nr:cytochrome c peroxidase [Bacteriovorax sp.]
MINKLLIFLLSVVVLSYCVTKFNFYNKVVYSVPLGLDDFVSPEENPQTIKKVELGKMLFFDPRLSVDGSISCSSCHLSSHAFTNGAEVAVGVRKQTGDRNVPTLFNRAYSKIQFWDGRASSLEDQAWGPILNPKEMGNTVDNALQTIRKISGYQKFFQQTFQEKANKKNVALALSAFERTLLSGNSAFDQYKAGNKTALNESAIRGMNLFFDKFKCVNCHQGSNFTNEKLSPRCYPKGLELASSDFPGDVSKKRVLYKVPTLRNIALSGPYMHNGKLATLREVIEFYNHSGKAPAVLGNSIDFPKIEMNESDKNDLIEFLNQLTGNQQSITAPTLP